MNEELKIVIKAITDEAKKNIKSVKDELDKVKQSGEQSGKSTAQAMKSIAKGVAVAVASVAALTTAMAVLGKRAQEVQKGFEKLNTTFLNAGSTTKQANNTYRELMGFLGDHDRAIETAQSLARITTETDKLAEYYDILAGSMAKYGDGLNAEAFSEQISETIASGKAMGDLARVLVEAGISEDGFNASLAQTASLEEREVLVRSTLNSILGATGRLYMANNQATIQYNQSQADLNLALARTSAYLTPLLTALNHLSAVLLGVLGPAIRTVSIYLTGFIQLIAEAIKWIGNFFGVFSSKQARTVSDTNGYKTAMSNYLGSLKKGFGATESGIDGNIKKLKDLKKQTLGFDELNVVSSPVDTSASGATGGGIGGGGIDIPTAPDPSDYGIGEIDTDFTQFQAELEQAKEKIKGIATLVGVVAGAFGLWKLGDFLKNLIDSYKIVKSLKGVDLEANWNSLTQAEAESVKHLDKVKGALTKIGGIALVVAGAILLIKGYTDAWANGVDWGNLATMLGGIALIVGGLALAFGASVAGIGAIAGGIALVIVGLKDFIQNGYSLESVLTILAGVLTIVLGVCLALNTAWLASPITWIVIGIASVVAAFVILWNECEGFRNFWIGLWEKVKELFGKFVDSLKPLIDAMVGSFKEAWELIKVIWNDYLIPLFQKAWERIKAIWDFVKPYFELCWNNIKAIFSVVVEVLTAYFKAAWEGIKVIWDLVVGYFTAVWNSIKLVFSVVKNVLTGNWQEAWNGIKGIVDNWNGYFQKVWDSIKKIFGVVATFFKECFGAAWEGIKTIFGNFKQFFTDIGNSLIAIIEKAINFIIKQLNKIKIELPDWDILGSLAGKKFGVNISPVSIPRLAKGGIVDSATIAMVGEQGKEMIVPLENNTGWMDKLADRLATQLNTPSKIVLTLDGRELGWANIRTINNITSQTGQLQLKMV